MTSATPQNIKTWALLLALSLVGLPLTATADPCPYAQTDPNRCPSWHEPSQREQREPVEEDQLDQTGVLSLPDIVSADDIVPDFPAYYHIENFWQKNVNGKHINVYAGALRYDPDTEVDYDPNTVQGFVIVEQGKMGTPSYKTKQINTPTAVGSLHITAATGTVLTLESRQGDWFSFDVTTEQLTPLPAKGSHDKDNRGKDHPDQGH
ncbi:MAG: hypothetical protein ACYC9J_06450 [Sulfuricaulis sp.]